MTQPAYFPFSERGWQLAMGLHPLPVGKWIEIDEAYGHQLNQKQQLLQNRYTDVFASMPHSQEPQQEALDVLLSHLLQHFPEVYRCTDDQICNQRLGQCWSRHDFSQNALDLAGRLVQEDLCLMLPGDEGYVLSAASLCFPFRWKLCEKLGLPMHRIHQPVPGYEAKLAKPVDGLFNRLRVDYPSYRFNWGVVNTADLFLWPTETQTQRTQVSPQPDTQPLWLRVERQTLRRLPKSGGILFTIHTYLHAIAELLQQPAIIRHLMTAIDQIPKGMHHYKNLSPLKVALLAYLDKSVPSQPQ